MLILNKFIMKKPSLKLSLIVSVLLLFISLVLYVLANWKLILIGENIMKELRLPTLFMFLGIYTLWVTISNYKFKDKQ